MDDLPNPSIPMGYELLEVPQSHGSGREPACMVLHTLSSRDLRACEVSVTSTTDGWELALLSFFPPPPAYFVSEQAGVPNRSIPPSATCTRTLGVLALLFFAFVGAVERQAPRHPIGAF